MQCRHGLRLCFSTFCQLITHHRCTCAHAGHRWHASSGGSFRRRGGHAADGASNSKRHSSHAKMQTVAEPGAQTAEHAGDGGLRAAAEKAEVDSGAGPAAGAGDAGMQRNSVLPTVEEQGEPSLPPPAPAERSSTSGSTEAPP